MVTQKHLPCRIYWAGLALRPLPDEVLHCSIELQKHDLPPEEERLGHLGGVLGTLEAVNHFLKPLKLRHWKTDNMSR